MSSKIYGTDATSGDNIMKRRLTTKNPLVAKEVRLFPTQKLVWHICDDIRVFSAISTIQKFILKLYKKQ